MTRHADLPVPSHPTPQNYVLNELVIDIGVTCDVIELETGDGKARKNRLPLYRAQRRKRYRAQRRKRHSTIEVHPTLSEAPHLRSSIPHPNTDFRKNQNALGRLTPWPKSTKRFLSNLRLTFRRFGVEEPRLSEEKKRNCATSVVQQVELFFLIA